MFRSTIERMGWMAALGALVLSLLACLRGGGYEGPPGGSGDAVRTGPWQVDGTLRLQVLEVTGAASGQDVELPNARVFLRRSSDQQETASAKTQLDGKFYLSAATGGYELCWELEGLAGCGPKFEVRNGPVALGIVRARADGPVIFGKVLTGDGRPCWLNDSFFGLDVSTAVEVLDGNKAPVRSGLRANVQGEYAVPGLRAGRYFVTAACEKAAAESLVSLGNVSAQANLTLPNHAPRIAALAAAENSRGVTRSAPGALVKLSTLARDADLDAVEYLWRALGEGGAIAGGNAATQDWTLPAKPGLYSLYVMARDGKGGYAYKRFDLQVGDPALNFSGRAIDELTKSPVAGAAVEVNGVTATTNAQGWFKVTVPPVTSERYVLNVRHARYALLSRIYDRSAAGNTYELTGVQTTTHDPGQVIDVADTGSSGPCGSPGGKGQRAPVTVAELRDQAARNRPATYQPPPQENDPCRHRGAHVVLPAGSLETIDLKAPKPPVRMAFATLNPARRPLPGDYRANDPALGLAELLSFGALYAEFRDADGKLLKLRGGTSAEIRVPVSAEQQPVAKPSIDIWSYDETTGFWEKEGTANLANTPEGWMYVGRTAHFSTINMDVAGNDPAQATCVRLEIDSSLSAWQNLVLRAYVSFGGTSVQVKETALDGAQYHAIYRIPFGTSFPPNTLRLELRGTFSGQQVVLLNNIINTDARPKMTGTNLFPPYPYTECGDPIVLTADPIALPQYGDIDATGRPAFLTGPYGQFLPANGEQVATDYYNAIDPTNAKTTLGSWWSANGFSAVDGSGGTRAAYLNHNDLGFGRDMNCRTSGSDLACFVTNYGLPDQNPANAQDAQDRNVATRGATVTMEYKASEPAATRVQFFVYGGGDATAGRIKFADLDGLGPKPVPHLCLVCHGGTLVANKATQARFREFDLPSFKYSGNRSWDFGQTTLSAAELSAFGSLNQMVRDIAPNPSPIRGLITNWYPTNNFAAAPVEPAVPTGWSANTAGYHQVFGKSCRTCHVARDSGAGDSYYTFNTLTDFDGTSYAVCGFPKVMPNAFVTYKNFWSDPSRVLLYRALTGAGSCQ